jgi:hypothetical protein
MISSHATEQLTLAAETSFTKAVSKNSSIHMSFDQRTGALPALPYADPYLLTYSLLTASLNRNQAGIRGLTSIDGVQASPFATNEPLTLRLNSNVNIGQSDPITNEAVQRNDTLIRGHCKQSSNSADLSLRGSHLSHLFPSPSYHSLPHSPPSLAPHPADHRNYPHRPVADPGVGSFLPSR